MVGRPVCQIMSLFLSILVLTCGVVLVCEVLLVSGAGQFTVGFAPPDINLNVGDVFTVNVTISNMPRLMGYEFSVQYNATALQATAAEIPADHFLKPLIDSANFFSVDIGTVDEASGRVTFAANLLPPEIGKTGSGVLATVTFKVLTADNSTLTLGGYTTNEPLFVDPNALNYVSTDYTLDIGYVIVGSGLHCDLNKDGKIDIADIAAASLSSFSYPGHPRWNPAADINGDGRVNIVDLVMIVNAMTTEQLPAITRSFDFGTQDSPVESEYVGVNEITVYSAAVGYGWASTVGLASRDRGAPDDLRRDLVQSNTDHVFSVDLPNGEYTVTLIIGDYSYMHDLIDVYVENVLRINGLTVAKGVFSTQTFTVMVSDGQLNILFHNAGGTDLNWVINAITIESVV